LRTCSGSTVFAVECTLNRDGKGRGSTTEFGHDSGRVDIAPLVAIWCCKVGADGQLGFFGPFRLSIVFLPFRDIVVGRARVVCAAGSHQAAWDTRCGNGTRVQIVGIAAAVYAIVGVGCADICVVPAG